MGRAPCCEKMGLKKGPWTHEEDQILISYIQQHGHANWRALPKHAGLLRCGKSCRLRWTNYLRPDIKRGNFNNEEEETIIQLHETIGNRWSAIAARLPGRTDNEIKNVWHTHLKKRLPSYHATTQVSKNHSTKKSGCHSTDPTQHGPAKSECSTSPQTSSNEQSPVSPQQSFSEFSSITDITDSSAIVNEFSSVAADTTDSCALVNEFSLVPDTIDLCALVKDEQMDHSSEIFLEIDENFWSEALSAVDATTKPDFQALSQFEFPLYPLPSSSAEHVNACISTNNHEGMDFWYNVFIEAEQLLELPEF